MGEPVKTEQPFRCRVRQYGDMSQCLDCRLTWDTNDPLPPQCNQGVPVAIPVMPARFQEACKELLNRLFVPWRDLSFEEFIEKLAPSKQAKADLMRRAALQPLLAAEDPPRQVPIVNDYADIAVRMKEHMVKERSPLLTICTEHKFAMIDDKVRCRFCNRTADEIAEYDRNRF